MDSTSLLEAIERTMPEDCELIIRTNHDPDGASGIPREKGNWFVHLVSCTGNKKEGNLKYNSLYKKSGNELAALLDEAKKCAEEWEQSKPRKVLLSESA